MAGRVRPNTLRALAFDLKTFFAVMGKDPTAVEPADVFEERLERVGQLVRGDVELSGHHAATDVHAHGRRDHRVPRRDH